MTAKDLRVGPIRADAARAFIRRYHYSGRVVNNSQIHVGVRAPGGELVGVLQFGPPMVRRQMEALVSGTGSGGVLELNRMAMVDDTPRNSESRVIAVACRLMAMQYPALEWVLSFADGTRCGDGTIYRASGFVLTGIKRNSQMLIGPRGDVVSRMTITKSVHARTAPGGKASASRYKDAGYKLLPGYQLRYIKFLRPGVRERLTVHEIPFSRIAEMGAGMYRGKPRPQ